MAGDRARSGERRPNLCARVWFGAERRDRGRSGEIISVPVHAHTLVRSAAESGAVEGEDGGGEGVGAHLVVRVVGEVRRGEGW